MAASDSLPAGLLHVSGHGARIPAIISARHRGGERFPNPHQDRHAPRPMRQGFLPAPVQVLQGLPPDIGPRRSFRPDRSNGRGAGPDSPARGGNHECAYTNEHRVIGAQKRSRLMLLALDHTGGIMFTKEFTSLESNMLHNARTSATYSRQRSSQRVTLVPKLQPVG